MRRFAMAVLLAWSACGLAAADDLPAPKIELPALDGFTVGKPETFDQKELGYGISAVARKPYIRATLYVYNRGLDKIPAGGKSDLVAEEMKEVIAVIETFRKDGSYKTVTETTAKLAPLGEGKDAPKADFREFDIAMPNGDKVVSRAYLIGFKDHFVKLRVTFPADERAASERLLAPLLAAVGQAVK